MSAREGFSPKEKGKMMLSSETCLGITVTGTTFFHRYICVYICKLNSCCSTLFTVRSYVELVWYLFKVPGVSCFLSERLSQDPLEKFFGCQRQRGGAGDNLNVADFYKNTQVPCVIDTTCANVPRGNCRGSTDMPDLEKKNIPLPKRRHAQK